MALNCFPLVVIHENIHLSHSVSLLWGQAWYQNQTSCPHDSTQLHVPVNPVRTHLGITVMGPNRQFLMRHPDRWKSHWRGKEGGRGGLQSHYIQALCESCTGAASSVVSFNLFSIRLPLSSEYKCTSRPDDNGHQIQRHWLAQRRTVLFYVAERVLHVQPVWINKTRIKRASIDLRDVEPLNNHNRFLEGEKRRGLLKLSCKLLNICRGVREFLLSSHNYHCHSGVIL